MGCYWVFCWVYDDWGSIFNPKSKLEVKLQSKMKIHFCVLNYSSCKACIC